MKLNREVIEKFNSSFDSYNLLSEFCDSCFNDVDLVTKNINQIIKMCFIKCDLSEDNIFKVFHNLSQDEINDLYDEYLKKKSGKKILFKKKSRRDNLEYIDSSIKVDDLELLKIPSKDRIEEICKNNINRNNYIEDMKKKRNLFYDEKRVFPEVGFVYCRSEMVKLDDDFYYYHPELSGNIVSDYKKLFGMSRYDKDNTNNPLNRNYSDNYDEITRYNDIVLKKYGNLYHINNGRHRIIYLLNNNIDKKIVIPVASVFRRIEDREFNIILKNMRNKYGVEVIKNNIFNDDPNILVIYDGFMYQIDGVEELKEFSNNLDNNLSNDAFDKVVCKKNNDYMDKDVINKCYSDLYDKYLEFGDDFIKGDFSNICKFIKMDNYYYLSKAYSLIQADYQRSLVFGFDFDNFTKYIVNSDKDNTYKVK